MTSRLEKKKFVLKEVLPILPENERNIIENLPILIRKNGLIAVLVYLQKKRYCLGSAILSYILAYSIQSNEDTVLETICQLNSWNYMMLQRDIYELAIEIKMMVKYFQKKSETTKLSLSKRTIDLIIKEVSEELKKIKLEHVGLYREKYLILKDRNIERRNIENIYTREKREGDHTNIQKIKRYMKLINYEEYKSSGIYESLIIGLGNPSVLETSITLNLVSGKPYIPATAIKGAFYAFCREIQKSLEKAGEDKKEEAETLKNYIEDWFGSTEKEGECIFIDCYPNSYRWKKDVMTPHYTKYYQGGVFPTDTEKPIPIQFDILQDVNCDIYCFCPIQWENGKKSKFKNLFETCIKETALGAKKSVGYGFRRDKWEENE